MSWGHATSYRPGPLGGAAAGHPHVRRPDEDIFSGSVVVDKDNTSGFGTAENPPLVAIYTSAYKDARRTADAGPVAGLQHRRRPDLDQVPGNPVLEPRLRQLPRPQGLLVQHRGGGYWVMAAVEATDHKVLLYKSANLKDWTQLSEFGPANATGGLWECPDLFPLAVDGDPNNIKWVMVVNINPGGVAGGSAGQYFVGDFDGTTFTSESTKPEGALPAGTPIAGFNDGTYNGWTVNNEPGNWKNGPFGDAPAAGSLPGQNSVSGFTGAGLVNSFNDGDWPLGSMSSPGFTVDSDYINFLVGGGQHPRVSDKLDNTPPPGDLLFNGFEVPDGSTLADYGWTGTGDLLPSYQPASAGGDYYIGAKRINTYETGGAPSDDRQGTLTSPEFTISRNFISMLVGGGHRSPETGQVLEAQLLVDGNVVRTLAGDDAGQLNWKGWDVSEFAGRQAQLRIVDQATGGWGHLTLDHVMLTDQAAVPRSDETTVNLVVDGQVVRSTTGANSEVLDWANWNVSEFKGRQAQIRIVDNNRFGWGHILADEFIASSEPAKPRINSYDWLDYGRDYYASVSFGNMPQDKRVMLGWMNNWDYANTIPTSPWRSAMSLPREVSLTQTPAGPRLTQQAVKQVDKLGTKASYSTKKAQSIAPGTIPYRHLPRATSSGST